MPIVRTEHKENFTQIINNLLNDDRLSYGARGLMAYALTHYDDWIFNGESYFTTNKDKLSKVKKYLKQLIDYGYLSRYQEKSGNGIFGNIIYIFRESPLLEKPLTVLPLTENHTTVKSNEISGFQPIVDFPLTGLPLTDSPLAENHTLNNTNITNTNINIYSLVTDYLNKKVGTGYKSTTKKTQTLINARLSEKFTLEDFEKVIDNKVGEWKGTDMEKYLRPETLFGTKFEGYLNQKGGINNNGKHREDSGQTNDPLFTRSKF